MEADTRVPSLPPSVRLPGLVLGAEALRLARHPSTWGLRTSWAASLAVTLAVPWALALADPRVDAGRLGHDLFGAWRDLVLLLAVGIGPVLVAVGGAEDRRDGSVDLLVLTGLSAPAVRTWRAVARMLALVAVVLGGLPLAALLASMGGVGPWGILLSVANGVGLLLALGVVAGTLAAGTGRVFGSVLAALAWGWVAFFGLPSLLEYALYSEVFLGWRGEGFLGRFVARAWTWGFELRPGTEILSPVAALGADRPHGLLPLAGVAVAIAVAAVEGRRPGLARRIGLLAAPAGVAMWVVGLRLAETRAIPMLWLGALVLLAAWTAVALDLARWALVNERQSERPPRPVVGDPVPWREVATGGSTGARPWVWWAGCGAMALLLAGWWLAPAGPVRSDTIGFVGALWVVAAVATVLGATSGVATEVAEGTWSLLVAAPRPAARLVAGKLGAVALQTLPVTLVAALAGGPAQVPWAIGLWACAALAAHATATLLAPRPSAWIVPLVATITALAAVPYAPTALGPGGGVLPVAALAVLAVSLFALAARVTARPTTT